MQHDDGSIHIRADRIERAIAEQGFPSVRAFAEWLGVHRNTVHNYLKGRSALPEALERMLVALDLDPGEVFELRRRERRVHAPAVADLVDDLQTVLPDAAIVLFGLRARVDPPDDAPYELGVFRRGTLGLDDFRALHERVTDHAAPGAPEVDVIDLVNAPPDFVRGLADELRFLAGSFGAWCALLEKAGLRPVR